MIQSIIELLKHDEFHNVSKNIDICKGKYQIPRTWKQVKNLLKRM